MSEGALFLTLQGKAPVPLKLFGMNLRFFYDSRIFKGYAAGGFLPIPEDGYRVYNFHNTKDTPAGWAAFGSTGALTYVNGALELLDMGDAINIGEDWTDIMKLRFIPKSPLEGEQCPSFILDKEMIPANGGFLTGSDGITITELTGFDNTFRTAPTTEYVEHYNWIQNPGTTKAPWGKIIQQECFTV